MYRLLTIVIFIATSLFLIMLSPQEGVTAEPTLVFWHSFTQPVRIDMIRQLADEFEQQQKVKVEIEVVPWPKVQEKWTSAFAAGTLPDVSTALPDVALNMWLAGATLPMDELVEKMGGRKAFLSDRMLDAFFGYAGQLVGLPYYAHARVLVYRKDLFAQKGLTPPQTWEDFVTVAQALTNPPEHYGMLQFWGKGDWGALIYLYLFMRSNNGSFFDKDGQVVFNTPENIEAVKQLGKLYEVGSPSGELSLTYHANLFETFTGGRTAMVFDTLFVVNAVKNDRPQLYEADAVGIGYPPKKKQYGWFADSIGLVRMKGKHPDLAAQFIQFLYQKENYIRFLYTIPAGMHPVTKEVVEAEEFWKHPVIHKYQEGVNITPEGIANGTPLGFTYGPNPFAPLLKSGIIEEMFHRIVSGGVSVEQAVADTHNELEQLVKRERRRLPKQ